MKISSSVLLAAAALLVTGCGGSGATGTPPSSRTKTVVQNGHRHVLSAGGMAGVIQSGVATNINGSLGMGGAGMGGGVGSGGSGGAGGPIGGFGGGMPMFGGYMKRLILGAGPGRAGSRIAHSPILVDAGSEGSGGGGSTGGPDGGDPGMGIDYDSWLGLYVTNSFTEIGEIKN